MEKADRQDGGNRGIETGEGRLDVARKAATKLHDEFASTRIVPDAQGMSIAWHKVPNQLGAWADWDPKNADHKNWYQTLLHPQGQNNFFVIGDQVSVLPGWQEGALISAEWAYGWITGDQRSARTVRVTEVPDAREITVGSEV